MAAGDRKALRLLALHSFRTSAHIFQKQVRRAGLDTALADLVELHYTDAPNEASGPVPDDVLPAFPDGPYFEWWNAHKDEQGRWRYDGWERSLEHIEAVMAREGPFDGVVGFSQGAAVAALVVGMQRSGFALQGHPQLRFCVCFAGIRGRDPKLEPFYEAMRQVPSVHIIGDRDPVKRMTNLLIETFEEPVVITHGRGHVIPALPPPDLQRLRSFLQAQARRASL